MIGVSENKIESVFSSGIAHGLHASSITFKHLFFQYRACRHKHDEIDEQGYDPDYVPQQEVQRRRALSAFKQQVQRKYHQCEHNQRRAEFQIANEALYAQRDASNSFIHEKDQRVNVYTEYRNDRGKQGFQRAILDFK